LVHPEVCLKDHTVQQTNIWLKALGIAVGASYPRRQLFADNESNCAALAEF
jgi:hypothetical protein